MGREDIAPAHGRRLIVQCGKAECDHAALIDPRPLFGSGRYWPAAGPCSRFRCRCGSRETQVSYTLNASLPNGPLPEAVIRLWC